MTSVTRTEYHQIDAPSLGGRWQVAVHGHWGRPVLWFPSQDGKEWESAALLTSDTSDLRDPKLDPITGEVMTFPPRQLRAFEKYFVEKTTARTHVSMTLTRKDLSYWSTVRQNWVMPTTADIGIEVGFSSRDLPLKGSF